MKCVKIAYNQAPSYKTPNANNNNNNNKFYKEQDYTDKNDDNDDDDDDICYQVSKTSLTPSKHRMINSNSSQTSTANFEWFNVYVPSLLSANNFIKVRLEFKTKMLN